MLRVATTGSWERRTLDVIPGQPPAAGEAMPGCRFAPRCSLATDRCVSGPVALTDLGVDRSARCVLVEDAARAAARHLEDVPA